ncbi:MAG: hypothetical protein IKQ91_11335 [Oscillospiraceae bacterium]|nr:hypothetical protein [Oscillospiraceae bacterium]
MFTYTAEKKLTDYYKVYEFGDEKVYHMNSSVLLQEAYDALADKIDLSSYDSDQDGKLDALIMIVPDSAMQLKLLNEKIVHHSDLHLADWWPAYDVIMNEIITDKDGTQYLSKKISGAFDLTNQTNTNQTLIHELGHSFGLDDVYGRGVTLSGEAGMDPMYNNHGDYTVWSKLALNWYEQEDVQVYTGGTQTFTLKSAQTAPNVLVIPKNQFDPERPDYLRRLMFYNDCLLVELNTPEQNMYGQIEKSGVRVLRGLRHIFSLVDDDHGYYYAGESLTESTPDYKDFAERGISIKIDEIKDDGTCTVTVTGLEYTIETD